MISGDELLRLKEEVVKDFSSSNWLELGALTNKMNEVETHSRLLRSLSYGDPDYDGLALLFIKDMIGPNGENLQLVRNYINEKCSMSGENISSTNEPGRKILFKPNIFQVPDEEADENLLSVMMPFNPSLSLVYEKIKSASGKLGLKCTRADDIWDHSTIIQDIFSLIFRSNIIVCDFTGKNPNVFYEAGIAHALGKHVVPITQSEYDIPFDLQHHRYLKYLNNGEGLESFESNLSSRLEKLTNRTAASVPSWL